MSGLRNNLLSIGKLQAKGVIFLFQNGTCKVFHPERDLMMETKMSLNRMFVLHAISQPIAAIQTQLKLMGRSGSRSLSYIHRSNSYRHSKRSKRDRSPSPYHSTTRSKRSTRSSSLSRQRRSRSSSLSPFPESSSSSSSRASTDRNHSIEKLKKEEEKKKKREAELKKLEEDQLVLERGIVKEIGIDENR